MSWDADRRPGLLAARLLAQSLRYRRRRPPATPLEQLQLAEQVLPGLEERIEREGYSEQEMADLLQQHEKDAPPPATDARKSWVPKSWVPLSNPRYWCGMLLIGGVWGYFGMPARSGHLVRPGWSGVLYGAGFLLAVSLLTDLVSRLRRRRRSTSD
jgi:hypothetical protein